MSYRNREGEPPHHFRPEVFERLGPVSRHYRRPSSPPPPLPPPHYYYPPRSPNVGLRIASRHQYYSARHDPRHYYSQEKQRFNFVKNDRTSSSSSTPSSSSSSSSSSKPVISFLPNNNTTNSSNDKSNSTSSLPSKHETKDRDKVARAIQITVKMDKPDSEIENEMSVNIPGLDSAAAATASSTNVSRKVNVSTIKDNNNISSKDKIKQSTSDTNNYSSAEDLSSSNKKKSFKVVLHNSTKSLSHPSNSTVNTSSFDKPKKPSTSSKDPKPPTVSSTTPKLVKSGSDHLPAQPPTEPAAMRNRHSNTQAIKTTKDPEPDSNFSPPLMEPAVMKKKNDVTQKALAEAHLNHQPETKSEKIKSSTPVAKASVKESSLQRNDKKFVNDSSVVDTLLEERKKLESRLEKTIEEKIANLEHLKAVKEQSVRDKIKQEEQDPLNFIADLKDLIKVHVEKRDNFERQLRSQHVGEKQHFLNQEIDYEKQMIRLLEDRVILQNERIKKIKEKMKGDLELIRSTFDEKIKETRKQYEEDKAQIAAKFEKQKTAVELQNANHPLNIIENEKNAIQSTSVTHGSNLAAAVNAKAAIKESTKAGANTKMVVAAEETIQSIPSLQDVLNESLLKTTQGKATDQVQAVMEDTVMQDAEKEEPSLKTSEPCIEMAVDESNNQSIAVASTAEDMKVISATTINTSNSTNDVKTTARPAATINSKNAQMTTINTNNDLSKDAATLSNNNRNNDSSFQSSTNPKKRRRIFANHPEDSFATGTDVSKKEQKPQEAPMQKSQQHQPNSILQGIITPPMSNSPSVNLLDREASLKEKEDETPTRYLLLPIDERDDVVVDIFTDKIPSKRATESIHSMAAVSMSQCMPMISDTEEKVAPVNNNENLQAVDMVNHKQLLAETQPNNIDESKISDEPISMHIDDRNQPVEKISQAETVGSGNGKNIPKVNRDTAEIIKDWKVGMSATGEIYYEHRKTKERTTKRPT
ncbi:hypothetical protein G6F60_007953 [Rhizopus arrhizus]|nr:hypothetical protein G6F60_007953 [Rhizopus arrhizus]